MFDQEIEDDGNIDLNLFEYYGPLNDSQFNVLETILQDTSQHNLDSELITCVVTGVFVFEESTVYVVCGHAQLCEYSSEGRHTIFLKEDYNDLLYKLITSIKKVEP